MFAWGREASDNPAMAKRRTPPLFEVLSVPDRRTSGMGTPLRRGPVEMRMPPPSESVQGAGTRAAAPGTGQLSITRPTLFLIIAGVMLVIFGVLYVAYGWGKKEALGDRTRELEQTFPEAPAGALPPGGQANAVTPPVVVEPAPRPQPEPAADPLADPRKPGVNYLMVANLVWKDAERAVAFLSKNGVPAAAVPYAKGKSKVDPQQARDKNLPHLVFVLEGVPSDRFKASEAARTKLVNQVRLIGKKWQSEEKGPSDFGEPYWSKYAD